MLADVQRATIEPLIRGAIAVGSVVHTDEYAIYNKLAEWGYDHRTVCHADGEFARDDDGDGFCEVHVNTMEGFWSLLRSWLRPHWGISQDKLPLYLGFFEFMHNVRARGKNVLGALMTLLLSPPPTRYEPIRYPCRLLEGRQARTTSALPDDFLDLRSVGWRGQGNLARSNCACSVHHPRDSGHDDRHLGIASLDPSPMSLACLECGEVADDHLGRPVWGTIKN